MSKPTLTALSLEEAEKVLRVSGSKHVTKETLKADIEAGAPANADGTINLVHYAAWLIRELARGD